VKAQLGPKWLYQWIPNRSPVHNLKLIKLDPDHKEYKKVANLFLTTISNPQKIIDIRRVINHRLRMQYNLELRTVLLKNGNDPNICFVKLLFHGSKNTKPGQIFNGEKSFMIQFSGTGNQWGHGIYFSEQASFMEDMAHMNHNQEKLMFLSEVIIGDTYYCTKDSSLRLPPEKTTKSKTSIDFSQLRYDSVSGDSSDGEKVYTVYENNKAYPTYLIKYVPDGPQVNKKKAKKKSSSSESDSDEWS